jgi:hypothetical protein
MDLSRAGVELPRSKGKRAVLQILMAKMLRGQRLSYDTAQLWSHARLVTSQSWASRVINLANRTAGLPAGTR